MQVIGLTADRKNEQKAKEIYRWCGWPDLDKFKRQKCRKLLVELQDRRWKEKKADREKRATKPLPPAYTDVHGNPISEPLNPESEN